MTFGSVYKSTKGALQQNCWKESASNNLGCQSLMKLPGPVEKEKKCSCSREKCEKILRRLQPTVVFMSF